MQWQGTTYTILCIYNGCRETNSALQGGVKTLLGRELMVSLRESKGASSLGDSSGCVTVKALDSSRRELGRAL